MLTQEYLRSILEYSKDTGHFKWIGTFEGCPTGCKAGSPRSKNDYLQIKISGKRFYAHRLAWFYIYGLWPSEIDHKDRNKQNNSLSNLREATHKQNGGNYSLSKRNKSGAKGIRLRGKRFYVEFGRKSFGGYPTLEGAMAIRLRIARAIYGEFASEGV